MKPIDLKPPFTWKERRVVLQDRILFVPPAMREEEYLKFNLPIWNEVHAKYPQVNLEVCSGNGDWIVNKALQDPSSLWLALEKRFDRCRKIWAKRENLGLENLFLLCGEAQTIARHYLQRESISSIWINFPDPWPKNRHAKYRLISPLFIEELARILQIDGQLTLATDDEPYCKRMVTYLQRSGLFSSLIPAPYYQTEFEGYGQSYFETLWRNQGRTIHYLRYQKSEDMRA